MTDIKDLITDNIDVWTSTIKKKSTTGRGSSKKIELTGINRLRDLILGLGLAGKLISDNFPLSNNIDDIIELNREKYAVNKNRNLKEYKLGDPILTQFPIPNGWKWKRVAELCDLQTGATPSRQHPEYFGGDNRWLVSGDINKFMIDECDGRVTDEGLRKSNCKILPEKTVMIALNGQGKTRATVALLNVKASCNQSLVGIIPFSDEILDSTFLLYALKYRYFEIRDITGQHQRRGLNMGLVAELSVPLPPLAEQHRIVAKVDELMALCGQLEQQTEQSLLAHQTLVEALLNTLTQSVNADDFQENWQRIDDHFDVLFTTEASIDQLKQTILQLAVMGKLVPQNPSDEPASKLLEKIVEEKAQLIKDKKYQKSTKLKPKVNSVKYPSNWVEVQTGEVCPSIVPNRDRPKSFTGNIPWVTLPSFPKSSWYLCSDDVELSLTSDEVKLYSARLIPKNSVLMSCVGRFGLTAINLEPVSSNQQVHAFIILDGLVPEYLSIVIQTAGRALESASTTTTIPYLNKTNCESIQFGLPPLVEQHRIVARVDELMSLCDQLKTRLADAQTTQLHLADAVVENALN